MCPITLTLTLILTLTPTPTPTPTPTRRTGYRKVKAWKGGTAGAGAQVVTNAGFYWEVNQADKYVMQKPLLFPRFGRSELA